MKIFKNVSTNVEFTSGGRTALPSRTHFTLDGLYDVSGADIRPFTLSLGDLVELSRLINRALAPDILPDVSKEEIDLCRSGLKIDAIKSYRNRSGCGLKEGKDAVEAAVNASLLKALDDLKEKNRKDAESYLQHSDDDVTLCPTHGDDGKCTCPSY